MLLFFIISTCVLYALIALMFGYLFSIEEKSKVWAVIAGMLWILFIPIGALSVYITDVLRRRRWAKQCGKSQG